VNTLKSNDLIGRVVQSTAGRDAGKLFIVVKELDDKHVLISDGKLRTGEKPKKKKLKHLSVTDILAEDIRTDILEGNELTNATIRKFLQLKDIDKEV
jgi:ribosomal protein L14E/L6E/L27E